MTVRFSKKNKCPICGNRGEFKYTSSEGSRLYMYNLCSKCEVIFIDSTPDSKDIVKLYPEIYSGYGNLGSFTKFAQYTSMIIKNKLVVSYFNGKEISKAVEVGPGLNPMLRKTKNIHELIYIDLAHVKLIGAFNSEINFIETNDASEALRLVDKCDLIVANQLIEHLLYPNLFMQNCYQSLTEGGLLFIETPNFASREFELFKKNGNWGGFHTPKHFNIFSNNSLMNLCEKYGFKVVAHSSIYSPFLWSESIKNYLDNKKYFLFKPFFSLKNPIALLIYLFIDSLLLLLGKNTSNQRIILRK